MAILVSKTYWLGMPFNFRVWPEHTNCEPVTLKADDFRELRGLYWTDKSRPKPKIGVIAMHPRADFTHHYIVPRFTKAGFAVLGANTRNPNNDTNTIHEEIILDVNACVKFLKEQKGIEKVVLFGNSGGGSLFAFFQAQARLEPSKRIEKDPAGVSVMLKAAKMVPADGIILCSAHKGEGKIMNECIDGSVVDENNPLVSDPELDMYDPRNGFKEPPEWTEYSAEFVKRYRAAQHERVRRIDANARALIDDTRRALEIKNDPEFKKWPYEKRLKVLRQEAYEPIMIVYRTMANPHYVDKHLDPSDRPYGSLISERPDLMNMQYLGFGRIETPRAWLSTWSGISSNADLCANLRKIEEPVIVVNAGKDNEIFPNTDAKPIFESVVSKDRKYVNFPDALHYFEPPFGQKTAPDVEKLMDLLVPWVEERFAK